MSSAAAAATKSKKSIKVTTALEGNLAGYKPYCVEFMRKHPSSILKAAIHAINCHTADMFLIMVDILADKYSHNVDEMVNCIKIDERWLNALEHPLVKSMSYFDQEDLENTVAANEAAIAEAARTPGAKAGSTTPIAELEAAEPTVKPKKSRKAAAVAAVAAVEEAAPVPEEEAPKPAKKSSKKKAAPEVEVEVEAAPAPAPAPAPEEEAPKPAKKSSKKKVAAAAEPAPEPEAAPAPEEEAPKPAKKSSKKKAAEPEPAPAPEVDELAAAVSGMSLGAVEETETAAKPKTTKKVVSKKPAKA